MEKVANSVSDFFGGNPFATIVGQRIEQATDVSLSGENWALNMEICDLINELEDGPKDAVRAIKKRFQLNAGKNNAVVMYTLTVLETCVKNCGRRFHVLVCTKDFIQELVKLIGPKNDPPADLQEKVLTLIQSWADAFQQQPELQGVCQVYQELKSKGIEFPMTNLDTMAPIITPQRTFGPSETAATLRSTSASGGARPAVVQRPVAPQQAMVTAERPVAAAAGSQPLSLSSPQMEKLQRELGVVENNMAVFSEMLAEMVPGQEHPTDLELLRDLHATCRAMQRRLVELVDRVANDEITAHLLKLNDDLNNLFLRYDRYEKNRQAVSGESPNRPSLGAPPKTTAAPPPESPSLIDLGDDTLQPSASAAAAAVPLVTANMQSLALSTGEESDFDMFAQSRTVTYESTKNSGSPYSDPDQLDTSLGQLTQQRQQEGGLYAANLFQGVKDEDIAEMEAWLEKNPADGEEDATLTPAMKDYLKKRSAAAAAAAAAVAASSPSHGGASSPALNPPSSSAPRRPDDSNLFSL